MNMVDKSLNQSLLTEILWKSRPDEWTNDERMNALFSPFRNRDVNPLHYDGKLNFWKKTIISFAKEFDTFKLSQKYLEDSFIRNGTKPKCLNIVLEALQKEKKLVNRNDFIKQQQQQLQSWVSFAFDKLVWSPLSWSTKYIVNTASSTTSLTTTNNLNQSIRNWVGDIDASNDALNTQYVFVELLEQKSIEIHEYFISKITYPELDCLIDYEKFQQICSNEFNITNNDDIELILMYLMGKKRVIVDETLVKDKKLIKFSQTSKNGANLKITDLETSYYVLKLSENKFEKQIKQLDNDIELMNKEIKLLLKQKSQQQALKLLKKRKLLEKQVDLKHNQLDNLHNLISNMQQVDTNKMAMNAFSKSVETMKNVHKEFDLDKIDDLMLDIQDNMKLTNEIESTFSKSIISNNDNDDQELEDELNELIKQKPVVSKQIDQDNDVDKQLSNLTIDDLLDELPDVPNDSFNSIKSPLKPQTQLK